MKIKLAEGLDLPIDIATQTLLVVGKRGTGKSNTCVRLAEELYRAKVPFVALDPTDTWWGLKASGDGKGPGLGVYVFGGKHRDLPLEPTAGALVADIFVERRISGVLAMKHFSGAERVRFVEAFCDRLLDRNSEPLHVFLEEAHEVAPQESDKGEKKMLGAVKKLWTRGRASGLSGSAITQRPASLHKTITTQSEILVVHRLLGPQDVAAIKEWIKYHGESNEILGQLATLRSGEAFIWAPDFPEGKPIGLVRVQVLRRTTFDSASTPKAGEQRAEPKHLAPVDIEAISGAMAATIERAKADDPKALRARVAELERELVQAKKAVALAEVVEVAVLTDEHAETLVEVRAALLMFDTRLAALNENIRERLNACAGAGQRTVAAGEARRPLSGASSPKPAVTVSRPKHAASANVGEVKIGKCQRSLLAVLAQRDNVNATQLSILSGYSKKSSSFTNALGALRSGGLIEGGRDAIQITPAGVNAAGAVEPLPTGAALVAHWMSKLGKCERAVFETLVEAGPSDTLTNEQISARSGYSITSSSFTNALGKLRTLKLIEGYGDVRASDVLFDGGGR